MKPKIRGRKSSGLAMRIACAPLARANATFSDVFALRASEERRELALQTRIANGVRHRLRLHYKALLKAGAFKGLTWRAPGRAPLQRAAVGHRP